MVEKGLKVGAIFHEDGSAYMVDKVLANGNYVSHRLPNDDAPAQEKQQEAAKTTRSRKSKVGA